MAETSQAPLNPRKNRERVARAEIRWWASEFLGSKQPRTGECLMISTTLLVVQCYLIIVLAKSPLMSLLNYKPIFVGCIPICHWLPKVLRRPRSFLRPSAAPHCLCLLRRGNQFDCRQEPDSLFHFGWFYIYHALYSYFYQVPSRFVKIIQGFHTFWMAGKQRVNEDGTPNGRVWPRARRFCRCTPADGRPGSLCSVSDHHQVTIKSHICIHIRLIIIEYKLENIHLIGHL